jgi:putative MATE family efflux protein
MRYFQLSIIFIQVIHAYSLKGSRKLFNHLHLQPRRTIGHHHETFISASGTPASSSQVEEKPEVVKKHIDREMLEVAIPAFIALAADPLASIVDAMYVGRLGAHHQAGMGIATSAQYSVAKLYNDPLLKTSTSLVAGKKGEELSASVATAISSAILIGILQCLVFVFFSTNIMFRMGVSQQSDMLQPALSYLRWRALGIPASTVLLVSNSIFRGRGDTKTPLYCTVAGNLANIILDPILIFGLKMECGGAGAATAISQWITAIPLLYYLHKAIPFNIFRKDNKFLSSAFSAYFKAGGLILIRTIAKVSSYAFTAAAAARLGTVPMAAYSLTFNLGFATSQLCESISIATQALLARDMPLDSEKKKLMASHVIKRSMLAGFLVSGGLTITTLLNQAAVINKLTSTPSVFAVAKDIMPVVLATQVFKGLAYSTGGILLGGLDWGWSTLSMIVASIVCVTTVTILPPSLWNIWVALAAFMASQVLYSAYIVMSIAC